jgi:hypothetical protein
LRAGKRGRPEGLLARIAVSDTETDDSVFPDFSLAIE